MNLSLFGKAINYIPRKIDQKVSEEIADKTGIATTAALSTVDDLLPILTTLLAGGKVRVMIDIKLEDLDGPSIRK